MLVVLLLEKSGFGILGVLGLDTIIQIQNVDEWKKHGFWLVKEPASLSAITGIV